MDALLASVLTAHGGLDHWSGVKTLTVHLSLGGPFWGAKGWPDLLIDETIELDTIDIADITINHDSFQQQLREEN